MYLLSLFKCANIKLEGSDNMGFWGRDGGYIHDEHDMNRNVRDGVPRPSGIIEESEYDKRRKEERQRQVDREIKMANEIDARKRDDARRDKEYEAASILKHEVFEAYNKQKWIIRFVAKRKGKDPYSRQSEIYNEALEQARTMSDRALDDLIRRGRAR